MKYLLVYGERTARPATQHEAVMAGAKVGSLTYYVFGDPLMKSHVFDIQGESVADTLEEAKAYANRFIKDAVEKDPDFRQWKNLSHVFSRILEDSEWHTRTILDENLEPEDVSVSRSVITFGKKAYIEIRWNSSLGTIHIPNGDTL